MADTVKVIESIVFKTKKFLAKTKAKGIVIGLSGGIDSTTCIFLLAKVLEPKKILAISMPEKRQEQDSCDAEKIAEKIGARFKKIYIDEILKEFIKTTKNKAKNSLINLKPRIRMSILYSFANSENYLVCGTGNKSELMLGYFTKHGDGACDFLPVGALFKTQVYEIARELGVPKKILRKKPSAGLYKAQSDEKELGYSYKQIDPVLSFFELNGTTKKALNKAVNKFGKKISIHVFNRIKQNKHKLLTPKVIIP